MGGREGANTLHAEQGTFRQQDVWLEDVSDPGVSYPTSSCCSISRTTHGPGFCVGQIDSSKGLASKFIMVVITHLRMVARGARPSKEIGNSAMKR